MIYSGKFLRAFFIAFTGMAACAVSTSAFAAEGDDVLASRFENTLINTTQKGVVTKFHYNADHTMSVARDDKVYTGTWQIAGDKVCTFVTMPGRAYPACFPVASSRHDVGEKWAVGRGDTAAEETIVTGYK